MRRSRTCAVLAAWSLLSACSTLDAPEPADRALVQGRSLYRSNGCMACHGPEGRGDGPLARTLSPPPRDFTNGAAFVRPRTVDAVADVIAQGVPASPSMPAYAHLGLDDCRRLASYVLSLGDGLAGVATIDTLMPPARVMRQRDASIGIARHDRLAR